MRFEGGLSGTILLTSGELVVAKDVQVLGPGAAVIIVNGGAAGRIFDIGADSQVLIQGLTIAEGTAGSGGGIRSHGDLTLQGVVVEFCHSSRGGGIQNRFGQLTLRSSTVRSFRKSKCRVGQSLVH